MYTYLIALAAALAFSVPSVRAEKLALKLPQKQYGIYLNAGNTGNEEFAAGVLERLPKRGIPALVFDVKEHYVYFESDSDLANEGNLVASLYDLKDLVAEAKSKGIYTIARYVALSDRQLGRAFPETRMRHPISGDPLDTDWVHPSHEKVLAYNRELITEVAKSGVDEINLDYIRYPTDQIAALSKMSTKEKIVHVEAFGRMARRAIDMAGTDTKLGLSTYAILGWHYDLTLETTGQDIARFAPFVDVISPMAYPQTFARGAYFDPTLHPRTREYYLVKRTLDGYKEILGEEHAWKIRPWIQGYSMESWGMREQIDAVYDAGFCGFTVWSQRNYYQPLYAALKHAVEVPDRCALSSTVAQEG